MRYVYRQLSGRLLSLFEEFPVVIVTGARQVGKTTLLRHLFADQGDYVVFDPSIDVENARREPELFLDNHREPLILDEVQYAPELVAALKRRVDAAKRPGRFLLTGNQQWQVLKNISESLAGRAVLLELSGFNAVELAGYPAPRRPWLEDWMLSPPNMVGRAAVGHRESVYERIFRGALPDATTVSLENLRHFHQSYRQTYIERDVRLLCDLHDHQQFGRFFQLAAALTAQEVNYSQLGRDIGLSPKSAQAWLALLRGTYQWAEIPPYHSNTLKRISGKAKGYFGDTGLACSAQAVSSPAALAAHPLVGALFETMAVNEIRRQCALMPFPPNLYHWRSHGGAEVDLLLERDGTLFPVEIKLTARPSRDNTRGLSAFRKTYPAANIAAGAVLCCADHVFKLSENDYALPWNLDWATVSSDGDKRLE